MIIRITSLLILLLIGQLPPARSQSENKNTIYMPAVFRQILAPSETEPNNTRAQANGPITLGQTLYGVQDNANDRYDIFFFQAANPGPIRITLTYPPRNDMQLLLHTATTVLPLRYDYAAPFEINYTIPTAGLYYVVLFYPGPGASSQAYELKVFIP